MHVTIIPACNGLRFGAMCGKVVCDKLLGLGNGCMLIVAMGLVKSCVLLARSSDPYAIELLVGIR